MSLRETRAGKRELQCKRFACLCVTGMEPDMCGMLWSMFDAGTFEFTPWCDPSWGTCANAACVLHALQVSPFEEENT